MSFFKNFLKLSIIIPLIGLLSCSQDEPQDPIKTEAQIEAVVEKIHEGFFDFSVQGGTKNQPISVENDGMDGVYGVRMADLDNLEGDNLALFTCVNSLNAGILQKIKINEASTTFAVCRYSVGLSYIPEVNALLDSSESERLEIIRKFDQGVITESELDMEMDDLRERFLVSYLNIKNFYSDYFRTCLDTLISEISVILNNNQWQSFLNCVDI
jgi:hypothetical protein